MVSIYTAVLLYVTALALVLSAFKNRQNAAKFFVGASFLVIGLLVCFRALSVGADTANYAEMFYDTQLATNHEGIEPGFVWLVKGLRALTGDARSLFIVQGIFVAVSYAYFVLKNTTGLSEAYLAVLSFLAFNIFSFHLSGVRQSLAMCICLFGYEMIKRKKLVWFLLLVALGSLFHAAALFFIPAYFIANMKRNSAVLWSGAGTIFGILFLERFLNLFGKLSERFEKYSDVEYADNGYIFFAVVVLITAFEAVYSRAIEKNTNLSSQDRQINYLSAGMWLMRLFTRLIERISFFYLPSTVIVAAHTPGAVKRGTDRVIYTVMFSVLLAVLYLYRMRGWTYSFC